MKDQSRLDRAVCQKKAEAIFHHWAALPDHEKLDEDMAISLVCRIRDALIAERESARTGQAAEVAARDELIQKFGDAATDVFEQMEKGNWRDDHGHESRDSKAMHDLKDAVVAAIKFRETILKESER